MKKLRFLFAPLALALVLASCQSAPDLSPSAPESQAPSLISSEPTSSQPASPEAPSKPTPSAAEPAETPPPSSSKSTEKKHDKVLFQGEPVVELYSLDYENRLYHPIEDWDSAAKLFPALEELSPDESVSKPDTVGFLVVTDQGKYAYYLDPDTQEESEKELVKASQKYNQSSTGIVQWLAYMSISNITHVYYSGVSGPKLSQQGRCYVKVDTADLQTIQTVGDFLKSMEVEKNPKIRNFNGQLNPTLHDLLILTLNFSTDVRYNIFGNMLDGENTLAIFSSDMSEAIIYRCSSQTIQALQDYMDNLKIASKQPW